MYFVINIYIEYRLSKNIKKQSRKRGYSCYKNYNNKECVLIAIDRKNTLVINLFYGHL